MDVRLLGPLEVRTPADGPVRLGGPRQRTLFGLLALRAPHVVSTPHLIDGIWDEDPPASATRTLHAHVAYLRRALTGAGLDRPILTRPPGYALAATAEQVDAHRFTELVRQGRAALQAGAADDAAGTLADALRLWRGDVLADCPIGEWARAEVASLRETRLYATEDLLAARLALGEHAGVAAELEGLVGREPLRERLWELLMIALYRAGRQGDALGAYHRARAVLAEELGVAPGAALREAEAAILAGADDPLAAGGPVRASLTAPPPAGASLPAPLTSLVGRRAEIDELRATLDRHRLVTLTGIGGCGKTRLAIAVAGEVAPAYPDGVRFVDLSGIASVEKPAVTVAGVGAAVAAALGVRERPDLGSIDLLEHHLRPHRLLLVLDNCEHLVEACAGLAGTLLRRCPGLRVLATSRAALGVPGEVAWPVPTLSVPTDGGAGGLAELCRHESVQLFLDRAAVPAVRALTDADAPALAAVCAGLDGLPLAVELAAARTSVLTLPEIADRIRDPDLLRHSALDAAMAWSYRLLEPEVRAAFRRLAVFNGGFTLDAAQALWGRSREVSLDLIADLVAKSLVVVERHRATARYRQLETIRHYAADRLAESPDELRQARHDHAVHYRRVAEDIGRNPHGPELDSLLDRMAAEEDNLLSAMAWYAAYGPAGDELRFATVLGRYFHLRGRYRDGRRWLEQALRREEGAAPAEPADRARALVTAANMALLECDYAAAARHGERALAAHSALGNARGVARSLSLLASVDRERGSYDRSLARSEQAVAAYRDADDEPGVADALQMAGFAAWLTGDLGPAGSLVTDALKRFQVLGDPEGIASARVHLAAVALYAGEPARARWLADDALATFSDLDFKEGIAWALNILGLVAHREGARAEALVALRASLDLHAAVGDRWRSASVLKALAGVLAGDDPRTAAELLAAAATIRDTIGAPVPPQERGDRDTALATVRGALTDREFYEATARGADLRLSDLPDLLAGNGREDARTAPPALGHRDPG